MHKTWIVLILLAFLIAACLPGQSPEQVQSQIETAVAQTVAAQNQIEESVALTVAAQNALSTPTQTPTVTLTITPLSFPTLTPFATFTPIPPPPSGGGGGGGTIKRDYACDIISRRPFDNSEIGHGQEFDIKWTIVNTGTKTWNAGYDVKYFSGPRMATVDRVEIPIEIKPKDTYLIVMDANAPTQKGFQVMTWTVSGDGTAQLCYPYVAIIVK